MRWEHLSDRNFEPAVRDCAGAGVIEPHGAHLPLGTDCFRFPPHRLRGGAARTGHRFALLPVGD